MTQERRSLIAGRFRVGGLLGTGGSASVFQAVDTATDRTVAIKLLHPHLSASEPLREAFLAEARGARDLQHPHIVEIIEVGVHVDGASVVAWIAEELVPGATLAEHVRTDGPLSPEQAIHLGRAVLDALVAAHTAGLVHRDVSPNNIMVVIDDGVLADVKLLDFGLADVAGATALGGDVLRSASSAATAGVVGNVHYASPEQLRGEPIDERGDVYQVGGVLYFAVTGRHPYGSADRDAVIRAHLVAPPPVPSVRARGVSSAFDRVVVRAMLKEPGDRFPDAAAMRAALESLVSPAPAATSRTGVTRVWTASPPTSPPHAPTSAPRDVPSDAGSRRDSAAWAVGLSAAAILAAVVVAVPLLSPAASTTPQPTSTTVVDAEPSPTASESEARPPAPAEVTVVVPPLAGLADTIAALQGAGLVVGDLAYADSVAPADTVLDSVPAPGDAVAPGTVVALTVASGWNALPAVAGLGAQDALAAVRAAGFDAQELVVTSSELPAGTAMGTDPAGGSQRLGSVVRVVVAARPVVSTPSPTPSIVPTPAPTRTAGASGPTVVGDGAIRRSPSGHTA